MISTDLSDILHATVLLAGLRRIRFGRLSQKLNGNIRQLELSIEDLETSSGELNAPKDIEDETPSASKKVLAEVFQKTDPLTLVHTVTIIGNLSR